MAVDDDAEQRAHRAKQAWRTRLRTCGSALAPTVPDAAWAALVGACGSRAPRSVAGFWPSSDEPDVRGLLAAARLSGAAVWLPVLLDDDDLLGARWAPDEPLVEGRRGTLQPRDDAARQPLHHVDLMLVPAVAAGRDGSRLGRGGGSYDRVLQRRDPACLAVAAVCWEALVDRVPTQAHDQRVDAVLQVAPSRWRLVATPPAGKQDAAAAVAEADWHSA